MSNVPPFAALRGSAPQGLSSSYAKAGEDVTREVAGGVVVSLMRHGHTALVLLDSAWRKRHT